MIYKNKKGIIYIYYYQFVKYIIVILSLIVLGAILPHYYTNFIFIISFFLFLTLFLYFVIRVINKFIKENFVRNVKFNNESMSLIFHKDKIITIKFNDIQKIYITNRNNYIYKTSLNFQLTKLTRKGIIESRYLDKNNITILMKKMKKYNPEIITINESSYEGLVRINYSNINQFKLLKEIIWD